MAMYARIWNGVVAEVFETDQDISTLFHPDIVWVDISDEHPMPGVLWVFSQGVFSPPVEDAE
ncbi:TPA: hypothetical protein L4556_002036 [Pseudomonas aeruginosa]|nr:hypothetical protein [Pseudomonas aeruginosa]